MIQTGELDLQPKLYVSTPYDEPSFREGVHEYWSPSEGRAAFHQGAAAAMEEAAGSNSLSTPESIFLSWVTLHTKTSCAWFYDRFGGPPARVSFDRPALVLHEHEAEDPRRRDGAGFTTASAAVCLPKPLRDRIEYELRARPRDRWIVVGFQQARFPLPQSRTIAPNSGFGGEVWTIETDEVEIAVF